MQSAEVQQQCVHVLGVLTTMLAVLQSDTEHVYQESHTTSGYAPSQIAWHNITATSDRLPWLLYWKHL